MDNFTQTELDAALTTRTIGERVSTAAIQRRARVGYIKARLIVEELVRSGLAEAMDQDGAEFWITPNIGGEGRPASGRTSPPLGSAIQSKGETP